MAAKSSRNTADIIIVGGGLAGLTLAALLGSKGAEVICLDRDSPESQLKGTFDGRTTAISWGSRRVLEAAGLWKALEKAGSGACAIETIHIMDGRSAKPDLIFENSEMDGRMFGWIVENADFRRCLFGRVKALKTVRHCAPTAASGFIQDESSVTIHTETGQSFHAPLVIGADGRQSPTREWMGIGARDWTYGQQAIVCTVLHEHSHDHIAVEHFRPEGPFAILPMTDDGKGRHRSSVVWTGHAGGESPLDWPQEVFDAALATRFPERYGAVHQTGGRFAFPLSLIHAHRYIAPRMALVAEAAHGIHPIAGQGLNMGFRDIAALSSLVLEALEQGEDPGAPDVLGAYQRARRFDNMAMAGATDLLNRLFSNDLAPVALARKTGLKAIARLPFAKRFFMSQAMGAAGILPDLIRDGREAA